MSIIEQVKELREVAEMYEGLDGGKILSEAADTIESLCQTASGEYGAVSGGWIPCKDRLPEEDNDVLIYTPYDGVDMAYISDENWRYTRGNEFINTIEDANILAWQPLPEPYHEH